MLRPDLILQHGQQIPNHAQPLREQPDALVHLQVTPHGGVNGLEARFRPHELGGVEHGTLQVDVDAEDEELADLLVDFPAGERDGAREGDLLWQGLSEGDGGA